MQNVVSIISEEEDNGEGGESPLALCRIEQPNRKAGRMAPETDDGRGKASCQKEKVSCRVTNEEEAFKEA